MSKQSSWWDDVDEMFDFMDGDDKSPKKKKKKKKAKPVATVAAGSSEKKVRKSLKGMSKSQLLQRMDVLGIPLDHVDVTSKRAIKDAIVAHMTGNSGTFAATQNDKVPVGLSRAEHEQKIQEATIQMTRPPYYIDEASQDFIIPNCVQTSDMDCFNGMMSLGMYRRERNPDDGFGELMRRLERKLAEMPTSQPSEIIDVTDFQVIDEPKAPKALKGAEIDKAADELLASVDTEQLARDIDKALEQREKRAKRPKTTKTV